MFDSCECEGSSSHLTARLAFACYDGKGSWTRNVQDLTTGHYNAVPCKWRLHIIPFTAIKPLVMELNLLSPMAYGFFPSTFHLWNSVPSSVFPASFNLPSFKRQVYHHLRDQMAWFYFITLFRYFINLFHSLHCFSFPFPMGCRLEKGHIVPVLCFHSQKKINKKKKVTSEVHVTALWHVLHIYMWH